MILKEFSDYIKSREALAEAFSESAANADTNVTGAEGATGSNTDNSGVSGNSAGDGSNKSESLTNSADPTVGADAVEPTKAMKTTKSTDATSTESATDPTNTTRKTDPASAATTPNTTNAAGTKNSTNDIQNTKNPKTEENLETEAAKAFRGAHPPQNSQSTDAAGVFQPQPEARSKEALSERQGAQSANDIQNTGISKTEERDKILQNHREAFSTTDSREMRGARGQEPVSRGVLQPQNSKFSCVKLLNEWLVKKLRSVPISNVDKIICNELFLATNKKGATLIIAKRESGRKLLRALYNFSLSYEHYRFARRTHEVRPSNFTNRKD